MAVVRVRQHVNPLSQKYQRAVAPPEWTTIYTDLSRPLHLDIGCGRGHFLMAMAQQQPDWNFLGLEIREPLVVQANTWQQEQGLDNLHFIFCNANQSLHPLLRTLPVHCLQRVTIQFPDPWFKKRHQKRRVVQPELVQKLADYLVSGGVVLLQSDVEAVAIEMRDRFRDHPAFAQQGADWLPTNPLSIPTEREQSTLAKGEPVYRSVFVKQKSK